MHKLHEMERVLTDPIVRPQKLYEIRWLSMYLAVDAIRKCLLFLEILYIALGLYNTLVSYQFLGLLHFYNYVISFASIQSTVHSVIGALKGMLSTDGPFLKAVKFLKMVSLVNITLF